jgi:hypothetical protein
MCAAVSAEATSLQVAPLSAHIGAEIQGVDLTQKLSVQQVAEIRAALLKWRVVFFREQFLTQIVVRGQESLQARDEPRALPCAPDTIAHSLSCGAMALRRPCGRRSRSTTHRLGRTAPTRRSVALEVSHHFKQIAKTIADFTTQIPHQFRVKAGHRGAQMFERVLR